MSLDVTGRTDPATPPSPDATSAADTSLETAAAPTLDVTPDSSPADATAASSAALDVTADSSSADGVDRKSLLDVTRAALDLGKPKDGQDSPPSNGQANGQTESTDATSTAPTDDKGAKPEGDKTSPEGDDTFADTDKLPFGQHPRFKKLLSQWKRDVEPAHQFREITAFMDEHGVSSTDAAAALKLSALARHAEGGSADHAKIFLQEVMPLVTKFRQLLGEEIAPDLQERVSKGSLDEEGARELTRTRVQAEAATKRATAAQETREREQESQSQQNLLNEITAAVSTWDAGIRTRDPDFSRKEKLIKAQIQAITATDGPPKTAKAAVELAERAYKEVNESFADLVPRTTPPPPRTARPSTAQVPRSQVRPQAKTPEEITRLALARTRTA